MARHGLSPAEEARLLSRRRGTYILPVTVVGVIDSRHYRVFRQGGWYELFASSAANLSVGDLVFARNVYEASQLFLPVVTSGTMAAVLGYGYFLSYPTVVYTQDVGTTAPVWTENRTGLPDAYWNMLYARLEVDPGNKNRAWALIDQSNSAPRDFQLYRNIGFTTAASWSVVYQLSDLLAALGYSGGTIPSNFYMDFAVCPSDPDLIGIVWSGQINSAGTHDVVCWAHSHDGGDTWTVTTWSTSFFGEWPGAHHLVFGANTTNKLYLGMDLWNFPNPRYLVWASDDHGHTITGKQDVVSTALYNPPQLIVPPKNNPSDSVVYLIDAIQSDVFLSLDSGASITQQYDGTYIFEVFTRKTAPSDADWLFSLWNGPTYGAMDSQDQGVTWTAYNQTGFEDGVVFALTSLKMARFGWNTADYSLHQIWYGGPVGGWANKTGDINDVLSDGPITPFDLVLV